MKMPLLKASPTCGPCCTRLANFGVTIGGKIILHDIDLHLHCGQLTALIGPNGAGKTTLMRAIIGDLPHHGILEFQPRGRTKDNLIIGYVPQRFETDPSSAITVCDLFFCALNRRPLWMGRKHCIEKKARESLASVGAESLLLCRIGSLSPGQIQRVLLALALTPVPNLLLLDEPISGLDRVGTHLFYHMIADLRKRYDLSILLIAHDLVMTAHVADRILVLDGTILCDGPPNEVLSSDVVNHLFGRIPMVESCLENKSVVAHHNTSSSEGDT